MKRYLFFLMLCGLASCERDNLPAEDGPGTYDPKRVIEISALAELADEGSVSRGTPITDVTQMTDVSVFCTYTGSADWASGAAAGKMFNTRLVRNTSNGRWEYAGGPVSWGATSGNDRYSFFAYAPYATAQNGIVVQGSATTPGIPALIYTVPTNTALQPDLMLALPRYNLRPATSIVSLQMKHALTCVGFEVRGNGEKIKSISLSGINSRGQAKVDGSAIVWTPVSQPSSFSPLINFDSGQNYYTATPLMSTNLLPGNGYLMMIPQTLASDAKLTLTFSDNTTRDICLSGEWIAGKKITYNIIITPKGIITISPTTRLIPQLGVSALTDNLSLTCDPVTANWTIATSESWLRLTTEASGLGAQQTISGTGNATLYTVADANTTTSERSATITVQTCPAVTTPLATLTQLRYINPSTLTNGGTPLTGVNTYVGAFWRNVEVGERIIRIPVGTNATNSGAWTASVIWMDSNWKLGDMLFSTAATTDPGVSFSLLNVTPGNAESYLVSEQVTVASGTVASGGVIYFRVGLRSAFTPTASAPARYAIIALTYNNKTRTQLIFLRQGINADYLMRPSDAATGSYTNSSRPLARKFSTFNLSAPPGITTSWLGGPLIANHPQLSNGGAGITEFPSQAGGFFQWASIDLPGRVYHPIWPEVLPIVGWTNNAPTSYWAALASAQEVCPAGYRRVNDGSESAASSGLASQSELRQSLFYTLSDGANSAPGNTMTGYYADGFFDRYCLSTSYIGILGSVVSYWSGLSDLRNAKVAYIGTIFYNPASWASIFFPSAGYRTGSGLNLGVPLADAGRNGYYWTSSGPTAVQNAFALTTGSGTVAGNAYNRSNAFNIRCVQIP